MRYFASLRQGLLPGGRVAVLEYGADGMFQSCAHGTRLEQIRSEMEAAGYTLAQELDFTTRQSFQIFEVAAN